MGQLEITAPAARFALALAAVSLVAALAVMGCGSGSPALSDSGADAAADLGVADALLEGAVVDTSAVDAPGLDKTGGVDAELPDASPLDASPLDATPLDVSPLDALNIDTGQAAEVVTCRFKGSSVTQSCSSSAGQTCSGIASCTVKVTGVMGLKLTWKSSCGGYAYTVVDGTNEPANFQCGPAVDSGPPPDTGLTFEVVTCQFGGSGSLQKCSSSGGHGCAGVSSCTVKVSGTPGQKLSWSSSCLGSPTSVVDGVNETVSFSCAAGADGGGADAAPGTVTEVVTCRFMGGTGSHTCYSGSYTCPGTSTCSMKVTGTSGLKMTWKSTCGGYAYTTLDGTDEPANFTCP
jgi:hypothetical protein